MQPFPEPPPPPGTGAPGKYCPDCGSPITPQGTCPKCEPIIPDSVSSPSTSPVGGFGLKKIALIIAIIGITILLILVGISLLMDSGNETQGNIQTVRPNSSQITATPQGEPVPVEMVPPGTEVYIQVTKDPITREISVLFAGGPGQKVLKEISVRITRQNGETLTTNLMPELQSEAVLPGSRGDDRVEVFAIYKSGQKFRIYDQILKERVSI